MQPVADAEPVSVPHPLAELIPDAVFLHYSDSHAHRNVVSHILAGIVLQWYFHTQFDLDHIGVTGTDRQPGGVWHFVLDPVRDSVGLTGTDRQPGGDWCGVLDPLLESTRDAKRIAVFGFAVDCIFHVMYGEHVSHWIALCIPGSLCGCFTVRHGISGGLCNALPHRFDFSVGDCLQLRDC